MTAIVYKYSISRSTTIVPLPQGSTILHVGAQNSELFLWALVDTDKLLTTRDIRVFGTGHPIDMTLYAKHIGTVMDGPSVWHIFDFGERVTPPSA